MTPCALVTGGAGFIGSHLARRLLAEGWAVRVLDNLSSGDRDAVPAGAELVEGDVRDQALVREVSDGCRRVFHFAAYVNLPVSFAHREECMAVNVDGTRCALEAALSAGAERFVLSSTSALYTEAPPGAKCEDGPLATDSPYAESKLAGERLVADYRQRGLDGVALRYFNVFGPGQPAESDYAAVIPLFISRGLGDQPLTLCGDGRQTRDFVYVEDVAAANWRASESRATGVYNVGTGREVAIVELADLIAEMLDFGQPHQFIAERPGDVASSTASVALAAEALQWRAQWSLEDGLRATVAWWRAQSMETVND